MKLAPKFLEKETRVWVNGLISHYQFEERHIRILVLAGECWDRLSAIRTAIKSEGLIVKDRFDQAKAHPLLTTEKEQKKLFAQLIRELGLDLEEAAIPRLPE